MARRILCILLLTCPMMASAQDTSDGIIWYPPIVLTDSFEYHSDPTIALSGDDTVHITWWGDRVPYRRSTDGGATFEPVKQLQPDTVTYPGGAGWLTVGAYHNRVYLVFVNDESQAGPSPLRMIRSVDGGNSFGPTVDLTSEYIGQANQLSIWEETIAIRYSGNHPYRQVMFSTDGGDHWTQDAGHLDGWDQIGVSSGMYHRVGHQWMTSTNETRYRASTDFGETWMVDTILSTVDEWWSDLPTIAAYSTECGTEILPAWRDLKYGWITIFGASIIARPGLVEKHMFLPEQVMTSEPRGTDPMTSIHQNNRSVLWVAFADPPSIISYPQGRFTNNSLTSYSQVRSFGEIDTGVGIGGVALSSHAIHIVYTQGAHDGLDAFICYQRGEFIPSNAEFSLSTGYVGFAETEAGDDRRDTIEVKNDGSGTLHIGTALSDDINFHVEPETLSIGPGSNGSFVIHFIPLSPGPKDGKIIFYHNGLTSPDCFAVAGTGKWHTETFSSSGGWQMISSPIIPGEYQTIPGLYSYRNGYLKEDTLKGGRGYWARPDTIWSVSGFVQSVDTINVQKGWNMIGSVRVPIARSEIVTIPDSLVVSDLFTFSGGAYTSSDTVHPGHAYWVKVSDNGKMVMHGAGVKRLPGTGQKR